MVIDFSDQYNKRKTVFNGASTKQKPNRKLLYVAIAVFCLTGMFFLIKQVIFNSLPAASQQAVEATLPPGVPLEAPELDQLP